MAKKVNDTPDEIDITVWQWITTGPPDQPTCASCHPGGGPLEFDRDGQRFDQTLATDPTLADSLDGDYRGSHWDQSGVLEADCLLCHLPGYDWTGRTAQLKSWNLKWAATAAGGLGAVKGRLFDPETGQPTGETPTVVYNQRLFNEDGKVVLDISFRPADTNCMQCHGPSDMKKRAFSWNDPLNPDVHNQQGVQCVDCHPAGLDHNFAKGNTTIETVRDDLDNTMRSCENCHTTGYLGASIPTHLDIPPSHLETIACETCHIPAKHRAAGEFFDTSQGGLHWDIIGDQETWGQPADWYPAYQVHAGQIHPVNPIFGVWWGNREADGTVYPLFARELAAGWELYRDQVTDDNGDGFAEVNRPEEIEAGLRAFEQTLAGNARFSQVHPVFIKGDKLWEFGEAGVLVGRWDEVCEREGFSISHNVAPARETLGADGCEDCHSFQGEFFRRTYIVDPFDENGNEVVEPVRWTIGISDFSYTLCSIHCPLVRPWIGGLLIVIFFVTTLHFTRFGPHDFGGRPVEPREDDYERIERFNWFERLVHLVVLFTFFFLAFTGLAFAFNGGAWLQLVFGNTLTPRVWHGWLGYLFGAGVILMLILWWRDAKLIPSDREWLRKLGGYLGGHEPVPADRFNAGQKVYFWTVVLGGLILLITGVLLFFKRSLPNDLVFVAVIIHDLAALFGVAGVLSHIYLSTGANPGTFQAIFAGWVTKEWARLHHPLWYEKVTGRPPIDPPEAGTIPAEQPATGEAPPDEVPENGE
ncbi:MAG: formate dehydrogenase subunit gamma [Chloroflexi bacterium]|nr:formate dehydrogenase subunit gamma [Chloroflexota bacterium]